MEEKEKIKNEILNYIKINSKDLPYIAGFPNIQILEQENVQNTKLINNGKYNSKLILSATFYKCISKIIDLNNIK